MDDTKISRLLRLIKLLTGNVSTTIDQLATQMNTTSRTVYRYIETIRDAGFVVNKLYGNVYKMGKMSRGMTDFKKLIYFTEEEAYLAAKMIEGIDNNNALKRSLQRKLASVYDCTSIANYIDNPANSANIEALNDAIREKVQVVLRGYESAHSDEMRDRLVEPFAFTPNMIDVWAYDVEKGENRVFKVMRIHSVEATETPWTFEDKHEVKQQDVFRMIGSPIEKVALQLNTRAKNLLVEEYPLAERDLKREDGTWVLRTTINSHEGAARFVIGLSADIKILQGKKLLDYIKKYDKKYIQKMT